MTEEQHNNHKWPKCSECGAFVEVKRDVYNEDIDLWDISCNCTVIDGYTNPMQALIEFMELQKIDNPWEKR